MYSERLLRIATDITATTLSYPQTYRSERCPGRNEIMSSRRSPFNPQPTNYHTDCEQPQLEAYLRVWTSEPYTRLYYDEVIGKAEIPHLRVTLLGPAAFGCSA